ncbi:MAG: choline dehydrogenase [Pseudomonadota bacterium]|nr:choline dehydrogenase [Pseudomonadota bacterium]
MAEYDYIIVGAGSAGCVLANRLSEESDVSVLLLEAGGRDNHPGIHIPLAMRSIFDRPAINWGYRSEPEPHCHGRRIAIPRGKVLGGTSSINAMIYARGHPLDYDQWRQTGLSGWGYADVLPYFKRSEHNWRGESERHGGSGPLKVTPSSLSGPIYDLFSSAAEKAGFPRSGDYNGAEPEGIARADLTIGDGRRFSTARAFLRPAMTRPNLTIATRSPATRVVIEGGRATGVEYRSGGQLVTAHAAREVVLSGGTYNSPQLMMLSGIGPADEIQAHGIAPVLDRPGVGANLQEHVNTFATFDCTEPISFQREMRFDRLTWSVMRWALFRTGPAAVFPTQSVSFIRTQPNSERPDIELLLSPISPDAHLWFPGIRKPVGHRFSTRIAVLHPRSVGRVTLRSSDPADAPRIFWNLLDDPADLTVLRDGLKAVRDIVSWEPLASVNGGEIRPGPEVSTDAEIEDFLRRNCETAHHPAGTCRMGADDDSVVDGELRVRGIDGLRVADCSVMPNVVGANTNAPTIMIAEKAADMIRGRGPVAASGS